MHVMCHANVHSDAFTGVLLAQLAAGRSIDEAIDAAQRSAIMTLASSEAVSDQIRELRE